MKLFLEYSTLLNQIFSNWTLFSSFLSSFAISDNILRFKLESFKLTWETLAITFANPPMVPLGTFPILTLSFLIFLWHSVKVSMAWIIFKLSISLNFPQCPILTSSILGKMEVTSKSRVFSRQLLANLMDLRLIFPWEWRISKHWINRSRTSCFESSKLDRIKWSTEGRVFNKDKTSQGLSRTQEVRVKVWIFLKWD